MKAIIKVTLAVFLFAAILSFVKRSKSSSIPMSAQIAFTSSESGNWDIWVSNAAGTKKEKITDYSGADYYPAWSPDGKKIAFTTYRWGGHRVGIMNSDGSNVKPLLSKSEGYNLDASWSPDGKFLVYFKEFKGFWQIFKTNINSGKSTCLSNKRNTSDRSPSWSPDGKMIVFQSIRDGNWEIYRMNANGSGVKRLTNNSYDDFLPSWSPDSKEIVFGSGRDNQLDIYTMHKDGSNLKNLTNGKPMKYAPHVESHKDDLCPIFTKDGKQVIWASGLPGKQSDLYIMDRDGRNIKPLLNTKNDERFPAVF